ncbi:uncharacterized protein METZ01_LOCUS160776 [marine metagenome]|uniref:Uncharacterized protein n=1 Tax=marine metagenome TaxID=408172 RepID=A0A382B3P2_9ZZZZ
MGARHRAPRATYPNPVRATPSDSYLVLLRVGFTLPFVLPPTRCALTAPFHPYRPDTRKCQSAVYFLWHFPSTRAAQTLSGTLPYGARTFLDPAPLANAYDDDRDRTAITQPTPTLST